VLVVRQIADVEILEMVKNIVVLKEKSVEVMINVLMILLQVAHQEEIA